jgi:putative nucleotidyltransferase with HDIG domain
MAAVPSSPSLLSALERLLDSPNPSAAEASDLMSQDMGMTAKVLQLVNCAFLGAPMRIVSARQAVSMIGVENLKTLVQTTGLFSEFTGTLPEQLPNLWDHSLATAQFAKTIAQVEKADGYTIESAFTAGLLHDIGSLILASTCEERLTLAAEISSTSGNLAGTPDKIHAQVGAYLLGLWGLPEEIVEAVAWHHEPSHANPTRFSPLIAVHVADHYARRKQLDQPGRKYEPLNEMLISNLGLQYRLPLWSKACSEIEEKCATNG